jgi:hypothetical protein
VRPEGLGKLLNNVETKFLNGNQMNMMVQNDKVLLQHLIGQIEQNTENPQDSW